MSKDIIGWVETPMVLEPVVSHKPWRVERGYCLAIILVRQGNVGFDIRFDAPEHLMRLDDGQEIQPIGVAVRLEDDFRGADGQHLPCLLSTGTIVLRQNAGHCFGYAYAFDDVRKPATVRHDGKWTNALEKLSPSLGGPFGEGALSMQITALSKASIRDHIPFCDQDGALKGFSVFRPPDAQYGIRTIGQRKEHSIVAVRVRPDKGHEFNSIRPQEIRVKLRDGTVLNATGLVIPLQGMPIPYGLLDKGVVTPNEKSIDAGGTLRYLYDYLGPITGVSQLDCKVVAAFDSRVTLDTIATVIVGNYMAEPVEGTVIFEG
jgi:hypothetical protein